MKRRSRFLLLMIMMLVVVATVFTMASCGEDEPVTPAPNNPQPNVTQHHYGAWELVTMPTSTEVGKISRKCTDEGCTAEETFELPLNTGDNYIVTVTKPSTCAEEGIASFKYNSETIDFSFETNIPRIDHQLGEWTRETDPTCKEVGKDYRECKICHHRDYRDVPIIDHIYEPKFDATHHWNECTMCGAKKDIKAHTYGNWTIAKEATETEHGTLERVCECGHRETEDIHFYKETVVEPTCETEGYTLHKCSVCGDEYKDTIVPAFGHMWSKVVYDFSPDGQSCTATRGCQRLDCLKKETVHASIVGKYKKAPTCKEDGEIVYIATFDVDWAEPQESKAFPVPKSDQYHEFEDKMDGEKHWQECKICNEKRGEGIHELVLKSDGKTHWTECKKCKYVSDPVPHIYGDWVVDIPATCTTRGLRHRECHLCGQYVEETIEALGHDFLCEADNEHIHHYSCQRLGCDYEERQEEHHFDMMFDGKTHWLECKECHFKKPATKHNWIYETDETGHSAHCADCGAVIEHTEHAFGDLIVDRAPTCSQMGLGHRECVCGQIIEEAIPRIPHHYEYTATATHHTAKCKDCGKEIEAEEHTFILGYNGNEHYMECTKCGYIKDVHSANWVDKWDDDFHWKECKDCGLCTEREPHKWETPTWIMTKAPSCSEPGSEYRKCSICGQKFTREIPAKGHKYVLKSDGTAGHYYECKDPLCLPGDKGHRTEVVPHNMGYGHDATNHFMVCECGYIDSATIMPHNYGKWSIKTEPTETAEGSIVRYCSDPHCLHMEEKKLPKLSDPRYKVVLHSNGCISKGTKEYILEEKGMGGVTETIIIEVEVDPEKHQLGEVTFEWSKDMKHCTATRSCTVAGCEYSESVTAEAVAEVKVEPGCMASGIKGVTEYTVDFKTDWVGNKGVYKFTDANIPPLDHHVYEAKSDLTGHWFECKYCGDRLEGKYEHTLEVGFDSVCHWQQCSVASCQHREQMEAHTLVEKSDETGHWMECECGYKSAVVPHAFGEWIRAKEPTCTEAGYICRRCACGYEEREEIPALGHDMVFGTDEEGHWRECSRCHLKTPKVPHETVDRYDETHHWTECKVCGHKTGVSEHVFDENGECACGYAKFKYYINSAGDGYILVYVNAKDKNIVVPSTYHGKPVVGISREAFSGDIMLESITLPASIKEIDRDAFNGCVSLERIYISDLASWCAIDFNDTGNPLSVNNGKVKSLFVGGKQITELVIPDGVTAINSRAFAGLSNITKVTIPSSVKTIHANAFRDCTGISEVVLAEGVTTIESNAFAGCTGLAHINIPSSVTIIGNNAFVDCPLLVVNVAVSEKQPGWGEHAFNGVTKVEYTII